MKKIILLVTILISSFGFSQTQTRDVVYLKNGSIIKGQIKEMNPSESLKIETGDGSLFVYEMSEILKMEKESYETPKYNTENALESVSSVTENEAKNTILNLLKKNPTHNCPSINFNKAFKGTIGLEQWLGLFKESDYEMIAKTVISYTNCYSQEADREPINFFYHLNSNNKWVLDKIKFEGEFGGNKYLSQWLENMKLSLASIEVEKKKKELQKKQTEQLKKDGDWKTSDLSSFDIEPMYLQVENVTMFENYIGKINIRKVKCEDCRNDNLTKIGETILSAIYDTNRYTKSNENIYLQTTQNKNANTANTTYFIHNINYDYKVNKDEAGKGWEGYTCTIKYGISTKAELKNPTEFDYKDTKIKNISSKNGFISKNSALEDALKKLAIDVKNDIYKTEQLSLKVLNIELDEKGKPEYLVFEKPINIFDLNKIEFMLIEKSALTIMDNKFKLASKIGDLTYKKSDFPNTIKCKIKGNKLKKELLKYLDKEDLLVGLSK